MKFISDMLKFSWFAPELHIVSGPQRFSQNDELERHASATATSLIL